MKIMVALDGSTDSLVGLEYASCLPLGPQDELILVSVAEGEPVPARQLRRRHGHHLSLLLQRSWAIRRAAASRTVERASPMNSRRTSSSSGHEGADNSRRCCSGA